MDADVAIGRLVIAGFQAKPAKVMWLLYGKGLSVPEIALEMTMTKAAVEQQLKRARRRLKAHWDEDLAALYERTVGAPPATPSRQRAEVPDPPEPVVIRFATAADCDAICRLDNIAFPELPMAEPEHIRMMVEKQPTCMIVMLSGKALRPGSQSLQSTQRRLHPTSWSMSNQYR